MIRNTKNCIRVPCLVLVSYCGFFSSNAASAQYSVKSDIAAQAEYKDNIFLTTLPHDSVYNFSIAPSVRVSAKDNNWESYLNGQLKSNNYSDQSLDSNDIYLDLSGRYNQERNIYTLSGAYDKASNLSGESTDFGIAGKRVNRKSLNIAPQYQRLLSERLMFSASYNYSDVDYTKARGTAYVPYGADTLSSSLAYGLTENDKLSFMLQATDYASKNNAYKYQLFVARMGIDRNISEIWKTNFSIGVSQRNSTNTSIQTLDFFGQPIFLSQVSNFTDRGYVLNAGVSKSLETGLLSANISRDDVANSYGGLNEVSVLNFKFRQNITSLWRYNIDTRYEMIKTVSGVERLTDRNTFTFRTRLFYAIDRQWTARAEYGYIQREFSSNISDNRASHSNMIFIGMSYNFPEISTF